MSDEGFAWECSKCGTVNGIHRDSCDTCGNGIYKSQAEKQDEPPAVRPTPETDEVLRRNAESDQTSEEDYEALADHASNLEYRLAEDREQRDRLVEAFNEWPRLREWLEMDSFIRGYMSAELPAFDAMSNTLAAVKGGQH